MNIPPIHTKEPKPEYNIPFVPAFAVKVAERSAEVNDADFAELRGHGFSDEDIWDIGAIAAFFALSNRMANVTGMRPNAEFYAMGR